MGFSIYPLQLRVDHAAHVPDLPILSFLPHLSALGCALRSHCLRDSQWRSCGSFSARDPDRCCIEQPGFLAEMPQLRQSAS